MFLGEYLQKDRQLTCAWAGVRPSVTTATSHTAVLTGNLPSVSLQLCADAARRGAVLAQVTGFLPLKWEARIESLAPGFGLSTVPSVVDIWGVN